MGAVVERDRVTVGMRRRITAAVFVAVALGATAYFAAVTVAPLIAADLMGSPALSGMPNAAALAGTAAGAAVVSRIMSLYGRKRGLVVGFALGALGAVVAVAGAVAQWFPLFIGGMLVLGFGNSASLLSRYAVAEVHPAARRTTVLGWVVFAGTIGAVVGPSLADPAGRLLAGSPVPGLAGGLVVTGLAFTLSTIDCLTLRWPPTATIAVRPVEDDVGEPVAATSASWRSPVLSVALTTMLTGQFVMVLIMTMTPVHARATGAGLRQVGLIMSLHVLGMYALAPAAGSLADRLGNLAVIWVGLTMLAAGGVTAAVSPAGDIALLSTTLLVLGLGWSFGFVAASGLLATGVAPDRQARVQGVADALVFGSGAVASLGSGLLIAATSYIVLCLVGAALIAIPAIVIVRLRPALSAGAPAV